MTAPPAVAVLGLGEAGAAIAGDIALSGNRVIGYDPVQSPTASSASPASRRRLPRRRWC